jgi:hypothetical protein
MHADGASRVDRYTRDALRQGCDARAYIRGSSSPHVYIYCHNVPSPPFRSPRVSWLPRVITSILMILRVISSSSRFLLLAPYSGGSLSVEFDDVAGV